MPDTEQTFHSSNNARGGIRQESGTYCKGSKTVGSAIPFPYSFRMARTVGAKITQPPPTARQTYSKTQSSQGWIEAYTGVRKACKPGPGERRPGECRFWNPSWLKHFFYGWLALLFSRPMHNASRTSTRYPLRNVLIFPLKLQPPCSIFLPFFSAWTCMESLVESLPR
jgi:hypothetical protein